MLKRIIFEPTYRCNLKCKMCVPFPDGKYKNKEITFDEIKEIFTQSKILKDCELIDISGGEPFLRDDICDIIELLLKCGFIVGITTNGWFTEKIKKLVESVGKYKNKLYITISIDGIGNRHDSIRGVDGSFDRAIDSIRVLNQYNIPIHINTVMQKDNYNLLDEFNDYFKSLGANTTFLPLATFNNNKFPYTDQDISKILPYINNEINLKYILSKGNLKITNCSAGNTGCFIGADGTVFTCLPTFREINEADDLVMGNLLEHSLDFDELWEGSQAIKARNFVKSCNGCFRNCEVSREVKYNNFDVSTTKEEIFKYKEHIPSKLDFFSEKYYFNLRSGWHQIENKEFIWTKKESIIYLKRKKGLLKENKLILELLALDPSTTKETPF